MVVATISNSFNSAVHLRLFSSPPFRIGVYTHVPLSCNISRRTRSGGWVLQVQTTRCFKNNNNKGRSLSYHKGFRSNSHLKVKHLHVQFKYTHANFLHQPSHLRYLIECRPVLQISNNKTPQYQCETCSFRYQ